MESVSEGQSMQYIVMVCAMVDTKKYVSEFSATSLWTYRNDWGCARLSEHLLVFSRHASEVRFICALVDHYFVVVVKFILRCVCYCRILSLLYLCDMVEEGCGKTKDTVTWLRSISFCWQLATRDNLNRSWRFEEDLRDTSSSSCARPSVIELF
jgi:hypothetical protein